MRIRLVHKQALLLVTAVLIAVLAMGALSAWNLRNGFSDFLATRDVERLEQFAQLISETAIKEGGIASMESKNIRLPELLQQFGRSIGMSPVRAMNAALPHQEIKDFLNLRPPPRPVDSIDAFKDRIAIYSLDGQATLGVGFNPEPETSIDRPVIVNDEIVAMVRMAKLKPVPNEVEFRFLNIQYQSMAVVAIVLLLTTMVGAFWVSGHWVTPLIEVQSATEKIAQGKFETRLKTQRSDEIGDTMRNVNQMAVSLQSLENSRRKWLADISHELRTPLTVLRGEIDATIDGIIKQSPESIQSLKEEVLKLNALVDDLHLLAIADLQALPCYFEDVDAAELVRAIVHRFQLQAEHLGLCMALQIHTTSPLWVRWDAKRIEQLIGNLLGNSLRYTDAPGQIFIALSSTATGRVLLQIEDTSPSVSVEELPKIFEPLFRSDASRNRSTGGSGLGLAICMQIAKAHHGELNAQKSQWGGVKLNLQLPFDGEMAS